MKVKIEEILRSPLSKGYLKSNTEANLLNYNLLII